MPAGMTGYPYGNCYYGNEPWEYYEGEGEGGPDWCPETNEEHQTTEAEFYNFIDYWVAEAEAGKLELSVDLERLRGRILNEVYIPNIAIEELFEKTTTLTRFYTTMDPEEMTKDPLFAFNADLPPVDSQMIVKTTVETDPVDCDEYVVADYPDGNRYTIECSGGDCWGIGTLQPVPGANPLKLVQVLDEWGDPINIDPAKADEVDAILNNAEPGSPSLPPDYEVPTVPAPDPVWPNPPAHADTTGFDTNGDGVADGGAPKLSTGTSGCAAEAGPSLGFLAALLSAALVLLYLRRQRRSLR